MYRIYLTWVGRWRHYRQLTGIEKPHVSGTLDLHFGDKDKGISIKVVPYLDDNYGYIIIDDVSGKVALVDPADPDSFDAAFEKYDITEVDMVLTTHKHWDHAGGNVRMVEKFPKVKVYGGHEDHVYGGTHEVGDGNTITFGKYKIECIATPCHTVGHMVFVIRDIGAEKETIAFTGDFLFMASWGMFFEGTANQMQECFDKFLGACPKNTQLLYGHEYALNDLKFAVYVDPDNKEAQQKLEEVTKKYENQEMCLPGNIEDELAFNPFLRADSDAILFITEKEDKIEALSELRKWKDANKHLKEEKEKDFEEEKMTKKAKND